MKFDAWEKAMLEKLVEKEILALPDAAKIDGRPVAPGPYAASLAALLKKLAAPETPVFRLAHHGMIEEIPIPIKRSKG